MRCSDAQDNLGRMFDGELDAPAARALEAHLAGCPACAREREALDSLAAALGALPSEPVPEGLERAILEAARFRRPRPVRSERRLLLTLGRVAAVLLIAVSGLYLGLRLSAVQQASAAPAAAASDPLSPDTRLFQFVPPGSPGALVLALASPEAP